MISDEFHNGFPHYEKRFAQAVLDRPQRFPWEERGRAEILFAAKRCLGMRDEWIPAIETNLVREVRYSGFSVECLQFASWPKCYGSAYLYVPENRPAGPSPIVLIACGHGVGGKSGYRDMAEHLARSGSYALIIDNIGQGERLAMGHRDAVIPFAVGLSVQGLIVMETMGWLNWIQLQERFDSRRIAAVGNSGGGTLTHFLGAFCANQLAAVSSSGYPSTYAFIHRKEKRHCHCNVIPHIVGELEMWQLFGCMAPTPLFIFQGREDALFPQELFWQTARKVHMAYSKQRAEANFRAAVYPGTHSWDQERRQALTQWLCEVFGIPFASENVIEPSPNPPPPSCFETWPADARTIDEVALELSGQEAEAANLWEVFPPAMSEGECYPSFLRGEARQIFAQYETVLKKAKGD